MTDTEFVAACEAEVIKLHEFFVEWMSGSVERTPEVFSRFTRVMADGFVQITPEGGTNLIADLSPALEALYGARPQFEIRIRNCAARHVSEDICMMNYEEWQDIAGEKTARQSSVLFVRDENTPEGVSWLHVHETWMPIGS